MPLVPEIVAFDADQVHHDLFADQVHQVFQFVLGAPVGLNAEEAVVENGAPHIVVVGLDPPRLVVQLGRRRTAVGRAGGRNLSACGTHRAAWESRGWSCRSPVHRRRNPARSCQILRRSPAYSLMGDGHEGAGGVRIQVIDQGIPGILVTGSVFAVEHAGGGTPVNVAHEHDIPEPMRSIRIRACIGRRIFELAILGHGEHRGAVVGGVFDVHSQGVRRQRHGDRLAGGERDARIGHNSLHGQLRILLADKASGKATGVVGFVLDPQLHPPLGQFLGHELYLVHVLRREVCRRSTPRRHVHHEDSVGGKPVQILDDPGHPVLGVPTVPTEKRLDGFVLRGGVLKLAAASRTEGTVICCQGCWAVTANETRKRTANGESVLTAILIERSVYKLENNIGVEPPRVLLARLCSPHPTPVALDCPHGESPSANKSECRNRP